jgi:hypothetical protein
MYTFEGHDAPVYSLCPHSKGNVHVRITLDSTLTRGGDIDSSPCLLKLMMTPSLLLLFIFLIPQFLSATSVNSNIKVCLYDNLGARVDYDAPGLGCTSIAFSGDRRFHLLRLNYFCNVSHACYI